LLRLKPSVLENKCKPLRTLCPWWFSFFPPRFPRSAQTDLVPPQLRI
jgi:hypothetical protein